MTFIKSYSNIIKNYTKSFGSIGSMTFLINVTLDCCNNYICQQRLNIVSLNHFIVKLKIKTNNFYNINQ